MSIQTQWTHTTCDHGPCFDLGAWGADDDPLSMLDLALCRQFRTEFDKERWLQRIEPRYPACHWPAHMVLGQSIGSNHYRIVRIPYRCQAIVLSVPEVFCSRVTLLVVQSVVNGRLCRFIVRRKWTIF